MDDWKLKVRTVVKLRECYFPTVSRNVGYFPSMG